MRSVVAVPVSRRNLRDVALTIRKTMRIGNKPYFPVLEFIEMVLPVMYPDFHLQILSKEEMGSFHGLSCPEENCIKLREDVYKRARDGQGRDRMTCAHEAAHFLLHRQGFVQLAKIEPGQKIAPYVDPEWQASALAAELLMPASLIKEMTVAQIMHYCKVSEAAARYQLGVIIQ